MISPSGGDDTAAIQSALDTTGYAKLDVGDFHVTSLNLTNRLGPTIEGCGIVTRIIPTLTGIPAVIDCTGASNPTLKSFRLFGYPQPVIPKIGILGAQMQGNDASDVFKMIDVRADGNFSLASLYVLAVDSSMLSRCQFYNYQAGGMTAIFTGNNFFGAASQFQTIDNSNTHVPSDWSINACEFHNMASNWALWLGACQMVKFRDGNVSSSAPIVSNNAEVIGGVTTYPQVIMDGMTFYSDSAPSAPYAISGLTTSPYMTLINCKSTMPLTGP